MGRRLRRFIVVGDNHGNKANRKAVAAALDFKKAFKPSIRIHLGDGFDFACLRKNASNEETREPIEDDIYAGNQFNNDYDPTHYLRGNHCERLWRLLKCDDGKLQDAARRWVNEIESQLSKAIVLPYHKRKGVLKIGQKSFLHGYHGGVNAARQAALIWGDCIMGHIHAFDSASVPGPNGRRVGQSCACLCDVDQEYNSAQANTLRQSNGFFYGFITPSGAYQTFQAESLAGSWYFPTEFRECRPV